MSARADITVTHRPEALLAPVTAIFGAGHGLIAYVSQRGSVVARPVEIGESDGTSVEVLSGVAEGELLMLVEPRSTAARPMTAPVGPSAVPAATNGRHDD